MTGAMTGPTTGATNGTAAAVASGATGTAALSGPVTGFTTDTNVLLAVTADGSLAAPPAAPIAGAAIGSSRTGIGELGLAGEREDEAEEVSDAVETMDESRAAL